MPTQRPQLKPALRRVWRDGSTLQLGVDPRRAVVIGGLDAGCGAAGREPRRHPRPRGARPRRGPARRRARHRLQELLGLLDRAGVLETRPPTSRPLAALGRPRARPAGARPRRRVAAARRRRRRRRRAGPPAAAASCTCLGAGRVGAVRRQRCSRPPASGTLVVDDAGDHSAGRRRAGRAELVATWARGARTRPSARRAGRRRRCRPRLPADRAGADLAVLAGGPGSDRPHPDRLVRGGDPAPGRPGPRDHRRRRPAGAARPVLLPALPRPAPHRPRPGLAEHRRPAAAPPPGRAPPPATSVLATAVAAHAALQVLAYLDGDPAPPAVDGTLEIAQADGRVRRAVLGRAPGLRLRVGPPEPTSRA